MHIILFDDHQSQAFLPITYTRPVGDIRFGYFNLAEKWSRKMGLPVSYLTHDYLSEKFPVAYSDDHLYINGRCLPENEICKSIKSLGSEQAIYVNDVLVAYRSAQKMDRGKLTNAHPEGKELSSCRLIEKVTDLFLLLELGIRIDLDILDHKSFHHSPPQHSFVFGDHTQLFIHQGAKVRNSTFNTEDGPIIVGEHAEIMEGSHLRGPLVVGDSSTIKMGAKLYGPTSIGPHCKIGGEVSNALIQEYSNKGHDGFLGNSVVGAWCNLGADTNNSNLKNNYGEVSIWDYPSASYKNTGLTFCGLIMGDHSKSAINTMFNTGTVTGVNANIFGQGFPDKFIPSFSWGGGHSFETFDFEKSCEIATRVCARRQIVFSDTDRQIMRHIFKVSAKFRKS